MTSAMHTKPAVWSPANVEYLLQKWLKIQQLYGFDTALKCE
jgi:hypothetical protein